MQKPVISIRGGRGRSAARCAMIALGLAGVCEVGVPGVPSAAAQERQQPRVAAQAGIDAAAVRQRVAAIVEGLATDPKAEFARAAAALDAEFDYLVAYGSPQQTDLFREVALQRRIVSRLAQRPNLPRHELYAFLQANPTLASTFAFALSPRDTAQALDVLNTLRVDHGQHLDRFANLAAAVCLVYDSVVPVRINSNTPPRLNASEVFDYFRRNDARLAVSTRDLPPELLVHVVDVAATLDELDWALSRFGRDREVGNRYKEIRYDYAHYKRGEPKKCEVAGWSLRSIHQHGGICADQAYFAKTVGKAMGIPSVYVTGEGSTVGHAWLGFLRVGGSRTAWDFSTGRYTEYRSVRGSVRCPQSGQSVSDGHISILTETMKASVQARQMAVALADAAVRLREVEARAGAYPPKREDLLAPAGMAARSGGAARLELLDAALRLTPASPAVWEVVQAAARAGDIPARELPRLAGQLAKVCGEAHADFSFAVFSAMIAGVADPAEQSKLWDNAFTMYKGRPDLLGEIRLAQAALWNGAGRLDRAWDCYQDVIRRLANDGTAAVDAARRLEAMLRDSGKEGEILPMYADIWKRVRRPSGSITPEFLAQSNWARIGMRYAALLEASGNGREAERIRRQIDG